EVRLSKATAFGGMDSPAPASRGDSAPSKTVTFMPRALSASAADNPPIPAPTMAMFSPLVIGPDPPIKRFVSRHARSSVADDIIEQHPSGAIETPQPRLSPADPVR